MSTISRGACDVTRVQHELYERAAREGEQKELSRRLRDAQQDRARGENVAIQRENEARREKAMRAHYVAADKTDDLKRRRFAEAVRYQESLRQREQKRQIEDRHDREDKGRIAYQKRVEHEQKGRERLQARDRHDSDMRHKEWQRRYFELDIQDMAARQRIEAQFEKLRAGGDLVQRTCSSFSAEAAGTINAMADLLKIKT